MSNGDHLRGLPGVFLVYEFSPFLIKKKKTSVPLSHLLTSMFVILGGIASIAGAVDRLLTAVLKKVGGGRGKGVVVF